MKVDGAIFVMFPDKDVIYLDDLHEHGHHIDGYVKDSSISSDLAIEILLLALTDCSLVAPYGYDLDQHGHI